MGVFMSNRRNTVSEKEERIARALRREKAAQCPFSFWTHLPEIDLDAERLAEATESFAREFDVDFIKTMPNGMYVIEDFGCQIDYAEVAQRGASRVVSTPVTTSRDWDRLEFLPPDRGALGRELDSLKRLVSRVRGEFPIVFTVFSPLTIAQKVSCNKAVPWLRNGEETARLHRALDVISQSVAALSERAVEIGAAGVFFATQVTDIDLMSSEQYEEFAAGYDFKALAGAREGWFNILHLHGGNVRFDDTKDYPVHALNWHVWETPPEVAGARAKTSKCLVGGIDRRRIWDDDREALTRQIETSWKQSGGGGLIVTPGCVVRPPLDRDILSFIRDGIRALQPIEQC